MKIPSVSIPSVLLCFSLAISPAALAQATGDIPRLTGIARIGDRECVVLEVPLAVGVSRPNIILHEGECESAVEVRSIKLAEGTAELIYHGSNVLVRLSGTNPNSSARNQINLTNAPLEAVLELFAESSNRTLLEHPLLPAARLAVTGSADDTAATAQIFAQALTNGGIASIPDGDKFLQIVPQRLAGTVQPRSEGLKLSGSAGTLETVLPAGSINFINAKMHQVVLIYAELVGRKLDRDASPALSGPLPDVAFRNHTPLTKAEIVYALDVQLAWCGVKMVTIDDKSVRLARLNEK